MTAEAIQKKTTPKYQYILAFVLGMVIMVVIYVLFDMSTNSEFRTRTGTTSSVSVSTTGVQLTKGGPSASSSITQTAGDTDDSTPKVYLGVEVMDLNDIMAEQLGIQNSKGVLINSVILKSPAAFAGLKRGDVITFMNNRAVRDLEGFKKVLSSLEPMDKTRIIYIRNKEKASTYAIVIAPPSTTPLAVSSSNVTQQWGVTLSSLSTALRTSLNIPANITGVVIVAVSPGGLADQAGLRSGDIIVAIDKTTITDMNTFFKAIDSDTNNTALLSIYSQGTLRYVSLSDAIIKTAGQPLTLTAGPSSSSADTTTATATTDTTTSTGSSPATAGTSANRPSSVPPPQAGGGPVSDTVLFIGLLLALILYLAYREFHRPAENSSSKRDN